MMHAAFIRRSVMLAAVGGLLHASNVRAGGPASREAAAGDPFARPTVVKIRLNVSAEGLASLKNKPREWVNATVIADDHEYTEVAVRLKGVTSFLPLDQKPSWSLSFSKYQSGRRWSGLRKIHLNNSVQDSSFICDDLASELFRRAGVPAARTTWAQVQLNDRNLGLYVLKEGFAEELLHRYFAEVQGNLYECATHQDIFDALERDSGRGPADHSDLKTLLDAARNPDLNARWGALQKLLQVDEFISMMAMEALTCHVDGYSQMQNNFRIYFDPTTKQAVFIVTGLDQMFGNSEAPLDPPLRGVLATAIMEVPVGRERYRARLTQLAHEVFQASWMAERIEAAVRVIEPVNDVAARDARLLRERVLARVAFVQKSLAAQTQPATRPD